VPKNLVPALRPAVLLLQQAVPLHLHIVLLRAERLLQKAVSAALPADSPGLLHLRAANLLRRCPAADGGYKVHYEGRRQQRLA
jgi:hypothetical protein